jgi:hypothetical protein
MSELIISTVSPLPWTLRGTEVVADATDVYVCEADPKDSAIIVQAVNEHNALLDRAERAEALIVELEAALTEIHGIAWHLPISAATDDLLSVCTAMLDKKDQSK